MKAREAMKYLTTVGDNNSPLFFILGTCAIENEKHTLSIAAYLKKLCEKHKCVFIFKSSFDKANRISLSSYRSVGLKEGMRILSKVREEYDVPIITDIHETWQVQEIAEHADIIQIPAMLCRQTDLLVEAGRSQKIVNIKKGQFAAAQVMDHAAKKVKQESNSPVWLCERGVSFGYGDLIVDFRNFSLMKQFGYPVIFDVTHSVQKPSGLGFASGGDRSKVADLAIAGVSQGIAGIFMEVHDHPENALSDGPNSLRLSDLDHVIPYLLELDTWIKSKPRPEVN